MEQSKHGGKRKGAGRKPVLSKKKQINLYVEGSKIIKFGSEEKLKEKVYGFIDGYGQEQIKNEVIAPKEAIVAPISKNTVIIQPKPQSELISSVNDFEKRLRAIKSGSEGETIMREVKVALMPFTQKQYLERVAKEVSTNFFND